jgi:hypothetical protein
MVEPEHFRTRAAHLFQGVADGTISEAHFWPEMDRLSHEVDDPVIAIAYEEAHHYWGNYHERNILLVRTKPKQAFLEQGRKIFRMLVQALEERWPEDRVQKALKEL